MTRHVLGVFENVDQVEGAVVTLLQEGLKQDQVSVLRWEDPNLGEELLEYDQEERGEAINKGMWSGGALGGIAALVAGTVSIIALPLGAVEILGFLATALGGATIGATVGGFAGSLMKLGLTAEDANRLLERLENGAVIVAVAVSASNAPAYEDRLSGLGASEIQIV